MFSAWPVSKASCCSFIVMSKVSGKSSVGGGGNTSVRRFIFDDVTRLGELLCLVLMTLPNESHIPRQLKIRRQ